MLPTKIPGIPVFSGNRNPEEAYEPTVHLPEIKINLGPVKWHKRCSRYHHSRVPCDLVLRERKAKSGKTVLRWVHPEGKTVQKRTRAKKG